MKAVIMAGGEGTRLRPLTCDRPKPMVPLMNRPMMEHVLELLKKHGFSDICVTLQYMPEAIKDYFQDGSSWGVSLNYFVEEVPLGTAGSVKNASSFLDETFLVASGDALTDIDLGQALEFHRKKGAMATLVLTPVEEPLEYGVVITREDGRITRFLEKPGWGEVFSDTVNTGIYILEPEALDYFEPGVKFDFSRDLFPLLMEKGEDVFGFVGQGYWCDIGNLQQYWQSHLDVLGGKARLGLEEKPAPGGPWWVGEGVVISPGAQITGPALVGRDCHIGPGARIMEYSVLGPGTVVGEGASLKRSVCWKNVVLGDKVEARGAVLCDRVRLEAGTSVFQGAVIGEESLLGKNCLVKPGVKIWPYKQVEEGTILQESLVWGECPGKNLFGRQGIQGKVNRDITPELCAKIGNAWGSLLKKDSPVTASCDQGRASWMLKQAFISGLLAAGLTVVDLGETLIPVVRTAIKGLGAGGGIHLQASRQAGEEISLRLLGPEGLDLSRDQERKVDQAVQREDFLRVRVREVGEVLPPPRDYGEVYRESLLGYREELPGSRGYRVVLGGTSPLVERVLLPVLEGLQVDYRVSPPRPGEEAPFTRQGMQERVRELKGALDRQGEGALGALIGPGGEDLVLVLPGGKVVQGDSYLALVSRVIFHQDPGGTVVVPVNAPEVIEAMARGYQGRVVRTRHSPSALMEELWKRGLHQQASFLFDAPAALVKLLAFMAREDLSPARLAPLVPPSYLSRKTIRCPWGARGKVMRMLVEENRGKEVEMLDGIKIRHPGGWALVLPDSQEPCYQVYGEGHDQETSEMLIDLYGEKIKEYQGMQP